MEVIRKETEESWFIGTLAEIAAFARRLVKQFLMIFGLGLGFNVLLTTVVGYAASEGTLWKGALGGGVMLGLGTIVAFIVAAQLSTTFAAAETIRSKSAGRKVLDALFEQLLGVTTEKPHGDHALSQALHGMPVREVRTRLRVAGRQVLRHRITAKAIPRIGLWLANRVQRLLVWAAVRVVTAYATARKSPDDTVDLLELRGRLAGELDGLLVDRVRGTAFRLMLLIGLALTAAAWGLVKLFHLLPG